MKLSKTNFQIIYVSEGCYRILIREKFFWFFKRWVLVTTQETENTDETPLEFKTFAEATDFIELITE